jgi:hypothetical protein
MLGLALPVVARRPRGGAAPPPPPPSAWTPASLGSQLAGWWDADDQASVTLAAGVSQWSDKSGNARHFLQATATSQPARVAGALNGRAGIAFSAKMMSCVAAQAPLAVQLTLVAVTSGDPGSTNNRGLLSFYPPGATNDYAQATALVALEEMANGSFQTYAASVVGANSGAGVGAAGGKILGLEKDAANLPSIRVNGALTPVTGTTLTGNGLGTATTLLLGARNVSGPNAATYGYAGTLHEIVLANVLLVLADRQKLEGYLASRWGLQAALPAGHPYKSAAP